jgi:hypothetical protein
MAFLSAVCTVPYKGAVVSLLLETLISGNHDNDTLCTRSTSKKPATHLINYGYAICSSILRKGQTEACRLQFCLDCATLHVVVKQTNAPSHRC